MEQKKTTDIIKVIIADDHEIFRDGLKLMLTKFNTILLAGEAANGEELVQKVDALKPDIVITDIQMPVMDGVHATKYIAEHHPGTGIIALSMFDESSLIIEMLEAGASGYLVKNCDKSELLDAITTVHNKGQYYCGHTAGKLAQLIAKSAKKQEGKLNQPSFSEKEKEIILLICEEYTAKQIAEKLFMSVRTVEGYRMKILEKLQVKNTAGIVIAAIKYGIYHPENI